METASEIADYLNRHGDLKFNDSSSTPPLKKLKRYSPSNYSTNPSRPQKNPNFPLNPSPSSNGSNSIEEISKGTFEAAITHEGGVQKSPSWVKSRLLGEGGYGSVYLATCKNDKKTKRAIKSSKLSEASSLMSEGRILFRLESQYIIRCYGEEIVGQEYNLILEYCSGESLEDLIEKTVVLSEFDVKLFARDILNGLSYIHERNIVHCDIKPDNLLLSPVQHRFNGYMIKIGDFGLAMEKGSIEYGDGSGHKRGTTRFMAPELLRYGIVDFGVDVWAFGCTVLEMLTGDKVWEEHDSSDWVDVIGESDLIPSIPSWLSEEAQDFLKSCLVKKPSLRWKIGELMNHPFLKFCEESCHNGFIFD